MSKHGFATRAIHAGQEPDPATGAVIVPIYQTSTFAQVSAMAGSTPAATNVSRVKSCSWAWPRRTLSLLMGVRERTGPASS